MESTAPANIHDEVSVSFNTTHNLSSQLTTHCLMHLNDQAARAVWSVGCGEESIGQVTNEGLQEVFREGRHTHNAVSKAGGDQWHQLSLRVELVLPPDGGQIRVLRVGASAR
jgi:hypothetical protein